MGWAVWAVGVGWARPGPWSAAVGLLEFRQIRVGEASSFGLEGGARPSETNLKTNPRFSPKPDSKLRLETHNK